MKTKSKIIVGALLVIALCASLIAGTTFALFSSEDKVNIAVKSGKVDVEANVTQIKTSSLLSSWEKVGATEAAFETGGVASVEGKTLSLNNVVPGDVAEFTVAINNASTVSVVYQVKLGVNTEDALAQVLDVSISNGSDAYSKVVGYASNWASLGNGVTEVTVKVALPTEVGSEYMGQQTDIALSVQAVQANAGYENGGKVEYKVDSADQLKLALEAGGNVQLIKDIAMVATDSGENHLNPVMTITEDTHLDLNGKVLSYDSALATGEEFVCTPVLIAVTNGATLTIDGNGVINADGGDNNAYGINVNDGHVIIHNGTFYGGITAVQVQKGTLEINDGYFSLTDNCKQVVPQYAKYVINLIDAAYKNGTASVVMKGGSVVGYNPANNPEGEGTTYLADGYRVRATEENGETIYTVVDASKVFDNAELTSAIKNAENGATINLGKGTFSLPIDDTMKDKIVTFVGSSKEETVFDRSVTTGQSTGGMELTVKNATVIGKNDNYCGIQHDKSEKYIDCVINNEVYLYAETVVFENCVFNQTDTDWYNVHTYGAKEVVFENCIFNTVRKSVLIYNEGGVGTKATFNNCQFNSECTDPTKQKAAVEVHTECLVDKVFTVVLNNCTYTEETFTKLVADNHPELNRSVITIDGVKLSND